MTFKQMRFKGKLVFVELDGNGGIKTEGGRAYMKYKEDDDRVYRPYPQNLTDPRGDSAVSLSSPTLLANQSASTKRKPPSKKAQSRDLNRRPGSKTAAGSKHEGDAIIAYTDGACIGNPGPSGLGYSVVFPDGRRVSRGEPLGKGTNNIAELTAIGRVLDCLDDPAQKVIIHTDSEYSIGVLVKGWKAKANRELILSLRKRLSRFPDVELRKVKGHAGIPENELVDKLARTAAETQHLVDDL